jgi:negative regulator of genetic competence, sporulation and motility
VVVERDIEKDTSDKIKVHSCDIEEIHKHPEDIMARVPGKEEKEEQRKESHVHFICKYKDYRSTINIAKFLREY